MLPNIVSWDETNKPFMQLIAMPRYDLKIYIYTL